MAHAEGRPHAGWVWVLPVSSPHVQSHGKYVCAMMCAYDVLVGRGAWAFEVRGRHVEAWCACGETVYRVQLRNPVPRSRLPERPPTRYQNTARSGFQFSQSAHERGAGP